MSYKQKSTFTYGWSRDMTQAARSRQTDFNQNPQMKQNFIMFPPDPDNKLCKTDKPQISCEYAEWAIKVPVAKYLVKLTVGDEKLEGGYSLKINGQPFLMGKMLKPDQFFTKALVVDANEEFIKITSECRDNEEPNGFCKNVWSRINFVSIEQYVDLPNMGDKDYGKVKSLGCGNSFINGRCIDGTNPQDCVYEKVGEKGSQACSGQFKIVRIPDTFKCKEQRNKFKCVLSDFKTLDDCKETCPGKCFDLNCVVPNTDK